MTLLLLFSLLPLVGATHHLHSLPAVQLDPSEFAHADALVYRFPSTKSPRCLLQTESKHFYLDASCQLLTRTSLKHVCPLNYTLKLEVVLPHNTTIYQLIIALKYARGLQATVSSDQSTVTLPFYCNGKNQHSVRRNQRELVVGNAHVALSKPPDEQLCQFESNPYRVKLRENELYQNFLQLKTLASCSAAPNYLLASSNAKRNFEYFRLDASTGFLSLTHSLDFESTTTWKLVIQGHDQARIPFYTYVIVEVEDINDCLPLLSWNFPLQTIEVINDTDAFSIEIAVLESKLEQANVVVANLIASDLDALPFNFELRFNASQFVPFQIHGPFADSTFVLSTSQKLDREQQDTHVLDLVLTDNGQPKLFSAYRLIVRILDDNDNAPTFDKPVYYVDIQENNPVNTVLLQVHANDADADDNGRVAYELSDSYNNYVTIDSQTGVIRTKIQFDYEQLTNLTFNVTAVDRPKNGQPLKSTAIVNVKIVDQNDNVPKFPQPTYEFSMYENNSPHSFVGQIIAHDVDDSQLVYALDHPSPQISSHFQISAADGKIYALNPLDREQFSQYVFYVTASDGQHKSPRVKVHINVLDLNDEIPRFTFPNDNNDTLIIDRTYWRTTDFICQIDIQDHDQIPNHTLTLLDSLDQLKNYDYLSEQKPSLQFDSAKFYLDNQGKLYFNASNGTTLNEGVYYLAFKIIDGANYFDEKLLKLIVVNNYERVQTIVKLYDHLGSHLNNRFSYLQYRSNHHNNPHHPQQYSQRSRQSSSLDESSKFLVFIVITVLSIILIGITFIFISLIRRKSLQQKELLRKQDTLSTSSALQHQSESSTTTLFKPPSLNGSDKRQSLRVSNCYEYNDLSSSPSLLMLNKDSMLPPAIMNDNCCLLEKLSEKEIYEDPRNKTYSSWVLSTSGRPESRYSQRSADSSTFHSLNRLSIPSQIHSNTNLSQQLCSPKRHSTMTYESTVTTSTTNSCAQATSTPSDYAVAIVSAASTNNSPHTPVSSDDGFCGSSDISDPPGTVGSMSLLSSHAHHSYRQPYVMMKEGIMHKSAHSPSYGTLLNRFNDAGTSANSADSTRRVRFNLDPDDKHQQRTILPLPTSNSPGRLADHALRRFEQLYMSRDAVLDKQSLDSTILYTNSTVV